MVLDLIQCCLPDVPSFLENVLGTMLMFFIYAGQDCYPALAKYLRRSSRLDGIGIRMCLRLQEALGWTSQNMETNRCQVREGSWTRTALCESLRSCLTQPDITRCDDAILADLSMQLSVSTATMGDRGGAGDAAMSTRWRKPGSPEAAPSLAYRCDLCEA